MLMKDRLNEMVKDWSVGKKLVVAEAVLVLILLSAFTIYIATYCGGLLNDSYLSDMKRQVTLAKGIFQVYDHTAMQSTEKFATVLTSYFREGFRIDHGRSVEIGSVETPVLLHGGRVVNNNFETIDRFSRMTGAAGTIFVRNGDEFVRISTSLKKEDGSRAIGTSLGKNHPGYNSLMKGGSYLGYAKLFGRDYLTKYTPIKGAAGEVLGILFVGIDTTEALNYTKQQIKGIRIGKTGYIYALDAEQGPQQGMLMIHPHDEGKSILDAKGTDGREFTREMINNREGSIRYYWMNKESGDGKPRAKTVVYTYYENRKMIIAAGAYEDEVFAEVAKLRYILLGATAAFIAAIVGMLYLATQHVVVKPLREAVRFAGLVAVGDLTTSLRTNGRDEIGQLGDALNRMVAALKQMVERIRETSFHVASAANDISDNSAHLARAAHSQNSATGETSGAMAQMAASIEAVAAHTESLAGNAHEVFTSIEELGISGEEVAKNAETMATSVTEVSTTMEQMTSSIGRMFGNNQELQKVVSESAATIEELAFSIREAAQNVDEADAVARSAAEEAGAGEKAIDEALESMMRVGDIIAKTAASLSDLGRRSEKIGNIVQVINDIAEQSNLLALNASILAAQAGEAGRSFAVVAEEMRTLARRSAEATREISEVINHVQAETANSVKLGELAAQEAQASMELSSAAGNSLANIVKNIEQTSGLMSNIARMTAEQAESSQQVIDAVERISSASDVAANTAQEQAAGSEQIRGSVEIMNNLTRLVSNATMEQSVAARQITSAVHAMNAMTQQVANATAEQKMGVKVVVSAVGNISDLTMANLASIEQLSQATRGLSKQAAGLAGLIEEFKVN